jgi:hypothetical protein
MNKVFDGLVLFCFILVILAFIFVLVYGISDFRDSRLLYNECITTDYDKFQCYAMIYGNK